MCASGSGLTPDAMEKRAFPELLNSALLSKVGLTCKNAMPDLFFPR